MNKLLLALLILCSISFAQVSADLTIENQQVVGTDFLFDIYLTRTGTNDIYLGNADFVLTFNQANFTAPVLSKEGTSPGSCTFVPSDPSGFNTLFTQDGYFSNTATEILAGSDLTINLNGPAPDATTINTRVAEIDNSPGTHCLGRFKVSGINNPAGFMNLQWKSSSTLMFTFNPSDLSSNTVVINTINPGNTPLPVELTTFTASYNDQAIELKWNTATETNNYGFDVERKVNSTEWVKIGFIAGNGNSSSIKNYQYIDKNITGGSQFNYRLKQIDNDGQFEYTNIVEVLVVPDNFELSQNFPNPFNPSTKIRFSVPVTIKLKLNIYNMLGEYIVTVADGEYAPGYYEEEFSAVNLPTGVYIYRLESKDFVEIKKMIFLK